MNRKQKIEKSFNEFKGQNLNILDDLYAPDVVFIDPFHHIHGLPQLKIYFSELYKNLNSLHFHFKNWSETDKIMTVEWQLEYSVAALNGGKPISVDGVSILEFNTHDRVTRHRDYFDAGQMLYEQIPILKTGLKWIKSRLGA